MTDPLLALRDADPAADLDAEPPEDVLERIVAAPPRRARRPLIAAVAAVIAAAAAIPLLLPDDRADLAARAYAATAPGERIQHLVTGGEHEIRLPHAPEASDSGAYFLESWTYGPEVHQRLGDGPPERPEGEWYDQYLGADGVVRNTFRRPGRRDEVQTLSERDGSEQREIVRRMRESFVERFRRYYRGKALRDGGETTFNGRPVRRYVVEQETRHPAPRQDALPDDIVSRLERERSEYFIDRETTLPVGRTEHVRSYNAAGKLISERRVNERVATLEYLDPTPENLAKVRP